MSVVLCERCFPAFAEHELHTMVPISACVQCGSHDNQWQSAGVKRHMFVRDPREQRGRDLLNRLAREAVKAYENRQDDMTQLDLGALFGRLVAEECAREADAVAASHAGPDWHDQAEAMGARQVAAAIRFKFGGSN